MFFHFITAYNALRHNGVEVGKVDYLMGKVEGRPPQTRARARVAEQDEFLDRARVGLRYSISIRSTSASP